eukprot:470356-Rhodomonas_salina.3
MAGKCADNRRAGMLRLSSSSAVLGQFARPRVPGDWGHVLDVSPRHPCRKIALQRKVCSSSV